MNLDTYKIKLSGCAARLNEKPFGSDEELADFIRDVDDFLDNNYETYLNANLDERQEIRRIIKDHDRSEKDICEGDPIPTPFRYSLRRYAYRTIKQLESTGTAVWLTRGLTAISILDGISYRLDDKEQLARLFIAAEEKGMDPRPAFKLISEISNNEVLLNQEQSTSELIANTPRTAREIVNELRRIFKVDKE
jgi:hypothetical protein